MHTSHSLTYPVTTPVRNTEKHPSYKNQSESRRGEMNSNPLNAIPDVFRFAPTRAVREMHWKFGRRCRINGVLFTCISFFDFEGPHFWAVGLGPWITLLGRNVTSRRSFLGLGYLPLIWDVVWTPRWRCGGHRRRPVCAPTTGCYNNGRHRFVSHHVMIYTASTCDFTHMRQPTSHERQRSYGYRCLTKGLRFPQVQNLLSCPHR